MEQMNATKYGSDADRFRETLRKKLLDDDHYRVRNTVSLIIHTLRLLFVGYIVFPGIVIVGGIILSSLNMDGGLADVLRIVLSESTAMAETVVSADDYRAGAEVLVKIWIINGFIGFTTILALSPWRSPLSRRINDAMERWHDQHHHGIPNSNDS